MLSTKQLSALSKGRLEDAKALASMRRYDGAVYLCGYAIEIALKVRISKTLKWGEFPERGKEFDGLQSFKTHNLEHLLKLSGWEAKIKGTLAPAWSNALDWNPELRYRPLGSVVEKEATAIISRAKVGRGIVMNSFESKLTKVAAAIDDEKGKLRLMAIAQLVEVPDRWDLLVSADQLEPWSLDAMTYIDGYLKKRLTLREKVLISRIVPLPSDNPIVKWVEKNGTPPPGNLRDLHPMDHIDHMVILWPKVPAASEVIAR